MAQVIIFQFRRKEIFRHINRTYENSGCDAGDNAERNAEQQGIKPEKMVVFEQRNFRNVKRRCEAAVKAAYISRCHGRDSDQRDSTCADGDEQQLDGEGEPADRRVERGGDAGRSARGDQDDPLSRRHFHDLPDAGAESGADLDDRTLTPHRSARTDGDGRGDSLGDDDDGGDAPGFVVDGVHHFRHAVSARFRRQRLCNPCHHKPAHNRHKNDQRSPRRRRYIGVCIVI